MKKSSKSISKKVNSRKSSSMNSGSSKSPDAVELQYLFDNYLELSKSEEKLIRSFDISNSNNQLTQYNLLKTLTVLNSRLYNFAVSNPKLSRASFDLIYPLLSYYDKINESYESNNSHTINQRQREMLSDVNSVVDLLSDIIEALQNADVNSGSSPGEGNERKQSTPQDLIDAQKKLNSKSTPKEGKEGKPQSRNQGLSDEEIADIIQKQEEIRNKFNQLNGGGKPDLDKEVKQLKKALLKGHSTSEVKRHQERIVKLLKDFQGEAKEKDNKRKSTSSKEQIRDNTSGDFEDDTIQKRKELLYREPLDYKNFYKNKINKTK